MTEPPARVRRRIEHDEGPGTPPAIRRMYWYGGAALGVLAGLLIALFAVPPIFDRYFGIADVALGDSYDGGGVTLRVASAGAAADPGRLQVVFEIARNDGWCPAPADFRLELQGRISLGGARLVPGTTACAEGGSFEGDTLTVSFAAGQRTPDQLHILHLEEPRVRFYLQPGEPGE